MNLQKKLNLLLIEKTVMREIECHNPHQKIPNNYQVRKVQYLIRLKYAETHMTPFELYEILNLLFFVYFNIILYFICWKMIQLDKIQHLHIKFNCTVFIV